MKRILVAGGGGYLGSVLVRHLLDHGYLVRVFDQFYYGRQGMKGLEDRLEIVEGDLRTVGPATLDGVDGVINLAGLSNDPTAEYNPQANFEINTLAAHRLARLCKERRIRRYLFASTCSVYDRGKGANHTQVQDEQTPVSPAAAYSRSKYEAERRLLTLSDDDFCPVILRKGTVFGFSPRMRYDLVVNTFVKDALSTGRIAVDNGGQMWRPLVDVRDVTRAYLCCLEAPEDTVRGELFNILSRNYRILDLALEIRDVLLNAGVAAEVRVNHEEVTTRSYRVSGQKIRERLGFTCRFGLEDGVRHLLDEIPKWGCDDFDNAIYYNIRWMKFLEEGKQILFGRRPLSFPAEQVEHAGSSHRGERAAW